MKQISFEEFKLVYKKNYEIIVKILLKHNVRFSCACGTMLGAIREKNIIEWDYDIDNFFFEEDLEQLLSIEKYLPSNFYIQSYKNSDLKYGLVRICCKNLFRHDKKSSKYINVFYDFFSLKNVSCPEQKRKKLFLKFIKKEKKAEFKVSTHKSANPFKELLKIIYKLFLPSSKNVSNKIQKKVSELRHGNTCIMCKSFKIVSPLPINKEEIIFVHFSNFKIPCYEKHIIILETLYGKDWRTPKEFGERKTPEFYIQ